MWVLQGDSGRAADSIVKAAVTIEDTSPDKAVDYCLQVRSKPQTDREKERKTILHMMMMMIL